MAVDWLRSCYQSEWALFKDAATDLIRGRYYFSPPGTPFYAGIHLLGSRVWDDNYTAGRGNDPPGLPPILGESRTAPHRWDSGALPVAVPRPVPLGSLDCVAAGDVSADKVLPADQIEGFPAGCFKVPDPNPDMVFGFDIWSCPTQAFWCQIIAWMYGGQIEESLGACQVRFQNAQVYAYPSSALYPPFLLVVHADYCCVAAAGSETLSQVLTQAIQLIQGPQDYGSFATGNLWYSFGQYLLSQLGVQGVTDGRPLMLAGHSYGGAAAMVAAAAAQLGMPTRYIRYLTFGSPKPGDERLSALLRKQFNGLSLVVDGDIVAAMLPSYELLAVLSSLLPGGPYTAWTTWAYPPESALLVGAKLRKNVYQTFDSLQLATWLIAAAATGQLPTVPQHRISAYVAAIALRCKVPLQVPADIGQVLGIETPTPGISTFCCPDALMPPVLICTVIAAYGSYLSMVGLSCQMKYAPVEGLDQWAGTLVWGATDIPVTLTCAEGSWEVVTPYQLFFAQPTPQCPPMKVDISFEPPSPPVFFTLQLSAAVPCPPEPPMPPGVILAYGGTVAPSGYLLCDGSAVSRSLFASLFGAIGTAWGVGDGSTTFNLPDMRGRAPIGVGTGSGLTPRVLAALGGEEKHQLVTAELSGHTHPIGDPGHSHGSPVEGGFVMFGPGNIFVQYGTYGQPAYSTDPALTGINLTDSTGGDSPHNNMQPWAACNFIIAY